MARKPRVWYPGACYHIMCRGNHRHNIFRDDEDREVYLYVLRQVIDAKPFILLSYCLMTNHVHLQMETVDLAPGIIMLGREVSQTASLPHGVVPRHNSETILTI